MSVRKDSPNTMPITQGSLDEIESIKVTGEKEVISSLLDICTHDKVIIKSFHRNLFTCCVKIWDRRNSITNAGFTKGRIVR